MQSRPPGLLPPPPRPLGRAAALRVLAHRLRSSVRTLVGGIFALVSVGFAVVLVAITLEDRRLLREGIEAAATVVAKDAFTRGSGDDASRVHEVSYEFTLPDGRRWAGASEIGRDEWNRIEQGDQLALRYDPANPDRHRLAGTSGWYGPLLFGAFPLVFGILGALLLRSGLPEVVGPVRLFRTGVEAPGRVTGLEVVTGARVNGRHPLRIRYAFADHTGAEWQGALTTFDEALVEAATEGAPVTVLHAPRAPQHNTLLAALGSRFPDPRLAGAARVPAFSAAALEPDRRIPLSLEDK